MGIGCVAAQRSPLILEFTGFMSMARIPKIWLGLLLEAHLYCDPMKYLPHVVMARINRGKNITGSFIDAEWVLHYIAAGEWNFQVGPRLYRVRKGDMVLTPPRALHVVRPEGGRILSQYVIHFEMTGGGKQAESACAISLPKPAQKRVRDLFFSICQEWRSPAPGAEVIMSGHLTAMLGYYQRHLNARMDAAATENRCWTNVEEAIHFMHLHYQRNNLTLREISRAAWLSPNYFCRVFQENTGRSCMAYLCHYRVERAEELLLGSKLNCTQIAEATGFSSVHTFSRIFARVTGQSPTLYKKHHGRSQSSEGHATVALERWPASHRRSAPRE
jgi:AraC-like DNA-binding protein